MEQKTRDNFWLAATASLLILTPDIASAACGSPYGEAADVVYNGNHNKMQYCNGTDRIAMGGAVQFGDGTAFAFDATRFFWDDTNNRVWVLWG